MPWVTRAASIIGMSWASPATAVEQPNSTVPARNTRRMPNRSPRRPPKTISAASGSTFAVWIHWPAPRLPLSPAITSGAAIGTAVWSTRIMLFASVMATSVSEALRADT
jgi:hypothetical protein